MLDNSVSTNQTSVREFILLGLSNNNDLQIVFFLLFLGMYMVTLSGNLLLILVVRLNPRLHTLMYFFLSNLSAIDICFSSTVVPKLLLVTISQDKSISFLGCATQMYFHLVLGQTESLILAVMAFDRYTAICKPLQYTIIMHKKLCVGLSAGCWIVSFSNSIILTLVTFQLPFCKSNLISHFFCEMPPLLQLSCGDIWLSEVLEYMTGVIIVLFSFLLILMSYLNITLNVIKIRSTKEKQKAFSTCASHLVVVSLYYCTIMYIHMHSRTASSAEKDRAVTILYTAVIPLLNPFIYSVRNKEIKEAIKKSVTTAIYH
ncbi:olfactory receptor 1F1-like [Pseudophryne corroboree]|uniref:olfactory receptor 1F1-like n=1 Tax=Pseudophryne corroboree TaxID=495146 RepID=UPI003081BE5A